MAIVRFDSLRVLAFGGISASYAPVGAALANNWRIFCITNNTNGDLFISADGSTDNLFIPANSFRLYDCSANAESVMQTDDFALQIGTQFYARQSTAPTSGSLYIEGIYAKGV